MRASVGRTGYSVAVTVHEEHPNIVHIHTHTPGTDMHFTLSLKDVQDWVPQVAEVVDVMAGDET